ncbi:hypothetical protein [Haladaptatus sp. DFWS20]|uniref:hypothetical protein n=1 Tax=Haladaptatus sp. DFWS20 TaxID=3403467 RepID=UPI003EBCE840
MEISGNVLVIGSSTRIEEGIEDGANPLLDGRELDTPDAGNFLRPTIFGMSIQKDLHAQGEDMIHFFTDKAVYLERWPEA